jgi:hypothetical protein
VRAVWLIMHGRQLEIIAWIARRRITKWVPLSPRPVIGRCLRVVRRGGLDIPRS